MGELLMSGLYQRETVLWIWVSFVFDFPEKFRTATRIASQQSRGPIQSLGLAIPHAVVGKWSSGAARLG
jgi:hypothetical protein